MSISRSHVLFAFTVALTACGGTTVVDKTAADGAINHKDPSLVVQAIFSIAQGGDAKLLGELCDPLGENDVDTRRICDYAAGFDPKGEFPMFFQDGKLDGDPVILGDIALVPFRFGPDGDKRDTMQLILRNEKWYLHQF